MRWAEVALGDHVDLLAGFAFKSAEFINDTSQVKLLRGDNVVQGNTRWDGAKYWPSSKTESFIRYELRKNDVVLAMDRPWIEAGLKHAAIRDHDLPSLLVQRVARLRAGRQLDQIFLRYVIASKAFTDHVKAITTGANVPHIAGRDIQKFAFLLPPLETQRRIADILSAYDDLIENNTRRIAILEDMARRLFEDWFVRSSQQLSWPDVAFTDLVAVGSGGTPKKDNPNFWGNDIAFFTPRDAWQPIFALDTLASITPNGLAKCNSKLYPKLTVFITARGTVGNVLLAPQPMAMNQSCYALSGLNGVPQSFIFFATRHMADELRAKSSGAVFDTIIVDIFRAHKMKQPPLELMIEYDRQCLPMLESILLLRQANTNLRATRDLLLPKLISGEIEVAAAEEATEAAAA